jgi:hypothetical protein
LLALCSLNGAGNQQKKPSTDQHLQCSPSIISVLELFHAGRPAHLQLLDPEEIAPWQLSNQQ